MAAKHVDVGDEYDLRWNEVYRMKIQGHNFLTNIAYTCVVDKTYNHMIGYKLTNPVNMGMTVEGVNIWTKWTLPNWDSLDPQHFMEQPTIHQTLHRTAF